MNRASIEIKRGNRVGKPFAVYAHDGSGGLARVDFATEKAARAEAEKLSRQTGWSLKAGVGPAPDLSQTTKRTTR